MQLDLTLIEPFLKGRGHYLLWSYTVNSGRSRHGSLTENLEGGGLLEIQNSMLHQMKLLKILRKKNPKIVGWGFTWWWGLREFTV